MVTNKEAPLKKNKEASLLHKEFAAGGKLVFFEHVLDNFVMAHHRRLEIMTMHKIGKSYGEARGWLKGYFAGLQCSKHESTRTLYFTEIFMELTHFYGKLERDPDNPLDYIVELTHFEERDITVDKESILNLIKETKPQFQ